MRRALLGFVCVAMFALAMSASAVPAYAITALDIQANALNDRGQVAGSLGGQAVVWDRGAVQTITDGYAYRINNNGTVIGYTSTSQSFVWRQDAGLTLLDRNIYATDLNDFGQIVGYQYFPRGGYADYRAFIRESDGSVRYLEPVYGPLASSFGQAINELGQAVGSSSSPEITGFGREGVLWDQDGTSTGLGSLGDAGWSLAVAINDRGQIVGAADYGYPPIVNGDLTTFPGHAFLWDAEQGMMDLGALSGNNNSYAFGINNAGQVVGTSLTVFDSGGAGAARAFLWDFGRLFDLNALLDAQLRQTLSLTYAFDINNRGDILAYGLDFSSGSFRSYILDGPRRVPEPGTLALLSLGLAGLGFARRRKLN